MPVRVLTMVWNEAGDVVMLTMPMTLKPEKDDGSHKAEGKTLRMYNTGNDRSQQRKTSLGAISRM